jgi:hypothetical protein
MRWNGAVAQHCPGAGYGYKLSSHSFAPNLVNNILVSSPDRNRNAVNFNHFSYIKIDLVPEPRLNITGTTNRRLTRLLQNFIVIPAGFPTGSRFL